jgi:tmRNA-binding protein
MYTTHNLVKLEIALASAKKKADKRDSLKKKAAQREIESYLRADKLKSQHKD